MPCRLRTCKGLQRVHDNQRGLSCDGTWQLESAIIFRQIGNNTYMYTGLKKEKVAGEEKDAGATTTEDEDEDMGDDAILISRSTEDVADAQVVLGCLINSDNTC